MCETPKIAKFWEVDADFVIKSIHYREKILPIIRLNESNVTRENITTTFIHFALRYCKLNKMIVYFYSVIICNLQHYTQTTNVPNATCGFYILTLFSLFILHLYCNYSDFSFIHQTFQIDDGFSNYITKEENSSSTLLYISKDFTPCFTLL